MTTTDLAQLVGGGVLVYFGAEWFVAGASAVALALGIPQLLLGLTVVAYGTSAPEIVVGIQAARAGHGEVAIGNVIGSNIVNIGLILGIAGLIKPARVDGVIRRRELPVLVASTALLPLLLADGVVSTVEGLGLLGAAVAYTATMVWSTRRATLAQAGAAAHAARDAADRAGAPHVVRVTRSAATALVGLALVLVGGELFLAGAVAVAHALGMSDRLIGLTLVAIGTSLPELVTSAIAARRGHADLAVGNVLGSNIFNVLLCLGAAGAFGVVRQPVAAIWVELVALGAMTALAVVFMRTARSITRLEAGVALAAYVAFMILTVIRG